ncbi:glycoside hydrolase family 30 beta sandwich domain-containing protein [Streptomyces monticola]|uniref:Glycoside hydrolase family 30 beta sandwich domain-containing protein n=1 Tax=Streptomyces monticola TaxID=2666263 RepID=A0ABW2JCK3_9ACTN
MRSQPPPRHRRRNSRLRAATAAAVAVGALATGTLLSGNAGAAETSAQVWITTGDGSKKLARGADAAFSGTPQEIDISVNSVEKAQEFTGAGASLTEASAHLIAGLPAAERDALMKDLFSGDGEGIGLDYLRQTLGGSDFVAALPYYSYEDTQGSFSIGRDEKEILPLVRTARQLNPGVRIMGSPWSAPAWMKDSGKLEGGKLKPEMYDAYADYLVKTLKAYAGAGAPVDDLTVQNEPLFETSYPSMGMSSSQQADFFKVLDGKLTAAGLDTGLFAYDHNWDRPDYPLDVLNRTKDIARVQGAAFHCYGGQPEVQQQVRDAGERVFFTECSGTDSADAGKTFGDTLKWQAENLVVRSMRSGSETVVLWNLALDDKGGPHFGLCQDRCNGVVEVAGGRATKNAEFYVLGHVSKFVDRGARRIASTSQGSGGLQNVTFENPDGERVSVVVNASDSTRKFSVTESGRSLAYELPAGAVATFTWPGAPTV